MKITDELLAEYVELNEQLSRLDTRMEEIKAALKEEGSTSTRNYVCIVSTTTRSGIFDIPKAKELLGEEFLKENELLRTTVYQVVKVSKKA